MAARKNVFHDQKTRDKIKGSQIINRLQKHIFGKLELSQSQVTAALGLLKKTTPDIKQVELSSDPDRPLVIVKDLTGE